MDHYLELLHSVEFYQGHFMGLIRIKKPGRIPTPCTGKEHELNHAGGLGNEDNDGPTHLLKHFYPAFPHVAQGGL